MADYQRKTFLSPADILQKADDLLPMAIGLERSQESDQDICYLGEEGQVILHLHRHGSYTSVTATTDRLRTSKIDYEIQKFLTELPYEPGDQSGRGSGDPS
ncbi:uncharacterized protein METZ01_LOCUS144130 [marine metagenome]|uniref:Uncharacterized protein n=1 Tax=marine metagenome TaxID=408172 RepID=A0A381ZPW0_9ZZZZ|tara:strand:+ start:881 stop:1183 length:303 start_codon:yes stop_codon:yes gene_type:complete